MAFETPTLDEDHAFAIGLQRALQPELDVSDFSHNWKWLRTQAGATFGTHAHIEAVKNDVMPDTATRDMADRWGGIRGVKRKTASPASKANALRFTGTPSTTIPDQTPLTHLPSGLQFRTVGVSTVGGADASVVAIDVGSKTRLNAGEVLTLQTPIGGVQDDAELQLALDQGGDDAELDDDYVPRYLNRFKNPPLGGTQDDFQKIATDSVDQGGGGKEKAYCYPNRAGFGTVDVAALNAGSGLFRIMTTPEVAALLAIYNTRRPVTMKALRVLTVVSQAVNVHALIVDDGSIASAFDWDDTVAPTCLAYTAGSRLVQLTTARPSTMQANDRITISDGATGKERVIESLSSTDSFVLVADGTGDVPTGGGVSTIYSGGPLVEPARQALQALFDSLGTANPDTNRYGPWEGNLRVNAIGRALTSVPGVLDLGSLVTPVATVVANDPISNPTDNTIGLLIAGRLLVRKFH